MAPLTDDSICLLAREHIGTIFRFLTPPEVDELCSFLDYREWPAETVVMQEGEPGDFMGFLIEGRLAVKKETGFPGKHILLAILDPGTMVGEISVVEHSKRNASVVTMQPSRLLILTRDNMDAFLLENPVLGVKFLRQILRVVSLRLRKADDRLARVL